VGIDADPISGYERVATEVKRLCSALERVEGRLEGSRARLYRSGLMSAHSSVLGRKVAICYWLPTIAIDGARPS
jgi:hypothetical protein